MYWYRDNWIGKKKEFSSLREAKKAAKNEYGVSVAIHDSKKKFSESEIICFARASGFTPA